MPKHLERLLKSDLGLRACWRCGRRFPPHALTSAGACQNCAIVPLAEQMHWRCATGIHHMCPDQVEVARYGLNQRPAVLPCVCVCHRQPEEAVNA